MRQKADANSERYIMIENCHLTQQNIRIQQSSTFLLLGP